MLTDTMDYGSVAYTFTVQSGDAERTVVIGLTANMS